jgi:hypothetical protein
VLGGTFSRQSLGSRWHFRQVPLPLMILSDYSLVLQKRLPDADFQQSLKTPEGCRQLRRVAPAVSSSLFGIVVDSQRSRDQPSRGDSS